jgi:predicted RNA-binding protein
MIIDKLGFIKNKNNYGIHFMGGVKKIPEKDFNLIAN